MFGCVPEVGLSTTPIPHLNDKPSDNAPENTNRNVNPVDDDNANEIPVPIDCEHECTLCNSLFQINEEDKYTCVQDQTNSERTHSTWQQFIKTSRRMISLEMPVPSQGHYGFHSFPVVD
jgi:hypothetical protein